MKALRNSGLVLAILFALTAGTAIADVVVNQKIPYNGRIWVDCANGGRGEFVRLSGDMHQLILDTSDANGGRHVATQSQPMGITGYGEITGDKYQGAGVTRHQYNFQSPPDFYPLEFTDVNNFLLIGPGQGNNLLVHETYHMTINANAEVTVELLTIRLECK